MSEEIKGDNLLGFENKKSSRKRLHDWMQTGRGWIWLSIQQNKKNGVQSLSVGKWSWDHFLEDFGRFFNKN